MNTGARVGLALTAGYFLGRFHKMKWALAVAALASRGRLPSSSGGLLQQGAKLLSSSPELAELTGEMRGRLMEAGKAAAVAAVSSKMDSLSEGLRERSETMRGAPERGDGRTRSEEEEDVEDGGRRSNQDRHRDKDRAADFRPGGHRDEDDEGRDQAERVPAPRGESNRRRAARPSRSPEDAAAHDRGSHAHRGEGNGAHRESAGRQPRGDGRSRQRSTTSRTGGDSE